MKKNVNINLKDNTLTILGENSISKEEKNKKLLLIENRYGKFSRSFTLPNNIRKDEISAEFKNGVLVLVLPKSEMHNQEQYQLSNYFINNKTKAI